MSGKEETMAYSTVEYTEVFAWSETLLSYAVSTDNGKTWSTLTDDEAREWYEKYHNIKTTNY
jgi:hypothetical protein